MCAGSSALAELDAAGESDGEALASPLADAVDDALAVHEGGAVAEAAPDADGELVEKNSGYCAHNSPIAFDGPSRTAKAGDGDAVSESDCVCEADDVAVAVAEDFEDAVAVAEPVCVGDAVVEREVVSVPASCARRAGAGAPGSARRTRGPSRA